MRAREGGVRRGPQPALVQEEREAVPREPVLPLEDEEPARILLGDAEPDDRIPVSHPDGPPERA
jgi:hypothetical protein